METKPKILIVDDSQMNREILAYMLEDEFDIVEARNGQEAIDEITKDGNTFSLMLLDIVMPEKDGFDVLRVMNDFKWIEEIPVIMISSETAPSSMNLAYNLGATDFITRPFNSYIVKKRVTNTIMLYAKQKKLIEIVAEQVSQREKSNDLMINILSHIVEFRNGESGLHVIHIHRITEILLSTLMRKTDKYSLTPADIVLICNASALHDIGKISIPDAILNKPGRFTPEEFEVMKTHSMAGAQLIDQITIYRNEPLIKIAYEICRWHHERYDGRGYPDGLKGDDIPISAQIVSIADVYDALTSERCYKKAFTHEKALEMILNGECGAFNPLILECLLESADEIKTAIHRSDKDYETIQQKETSIITREILNSSNISGNNLTSAMLEYERGKSDFFFKSSNRIIFEYHKSADMLIIPQKLAKIYGLETTVRNPRANEKILSIISLEDIEAIAEKARQKQSEIIEHECTIHIDGKDLHGVFICKSAVTSDIDPEVSGVLGQFEQY